MDLFYKAIYGPKLTEGHLSIMMIFAPSLNSADLAIDNVSLLIYLTMAIHKVVTVKLTILMTIRTPLITAIRRK